MNDQIACPFCGNDKLVELPIASRFDKGGWVLLAREGFKAYRCAVCNTVFHDDEAEPLDAGKPHGQV